MLKFLKFLLIAVLGITATFICGGIIATAAQAPFWVGGTIAVVGSAVVGIVKDAIPPDALRAGIFTEVWTGYLIKAFRAAEESLGWYGRIQSFDQYVENDVIHLVSIGADPDILLNNTTYPLPIQSIEDLDKPISLDKYQSKVIPVTDDEAYASSYDKMSTRIEQIKFAYLEKKFGKAIHALAPDKHRDTTPVLLTTGANDGTGRKKMTWNDILQLKRAFDKNKVPKEGRILVLTSDHVSDLCEASQNFENQFYNLTTGQVLNRYGFDIYEYTNCPYYTVANKTKLAYGAIPDETANQASVAFYVKRAMRADGSLKTYIRLAENDPATQTSTISIRAYNICTPIKNDALGAIVSDIAV